jgi:hypothetical protein
MAIRKTTKGKGRNYLSTKEGAGNASGDFLKSGEHYVYLHRKPKTNEVFYVGLGKYFRCNQVCASHRNKYWNSIYNKYGRIVEIVNSGLSVEEAKLLEIENIKIYKPVANLTKGGDYCSCAQKIQVHSYSLLGDYVNSYESIMAANITLDKNPKSQVIKRALDKENSMCYGFMWRTSKLKKISPYKKSPAYNIKKIHCYNENGFYIKSYNKVSDVIKDGFSRTGVSNVMNKLDRTTNGCFFNEKKTHALKIVKPKPALKKSRKVIDVITGEIFQSIGKASKKASCGTETLRRKLTGKRRNNTNMIFYYEQQN